jgi:predicted nucleotidyltransferase
MNEQGFVSVICEYNPFHYGHEHQIKQLKNEFDGVVCIMSGDIVQRGTFAVAGKYLRARAALECGADLVLELPLPWCCSSARDFARAGVHIADAIGSGALAFGSEDGLETLLEIHSLTSKREFAESVKELVEKNGNLSYPQAFALAVANALGDEYAESVKKPNNILGMEYISALDGKNVNPFSVQREQKFGSSSSIRAHLTGEKMIALIPEKSASVFESALGTDFPRNTGKLDTFFIATLRNLASRGNVPANIYSVTDDLIKKILSASVKVSSFDALVDYCTDKTYTSARVRRAVIATVFGITTEKVKTMPCYTSVLAANEKGREILKSAKTKNSIDIITKPVRALTLGETTKEAFLFSKSIEDIVSLSSPVPEPSDVGKSPYIK